jgi:hypothetical protein
MPVCEKKMTETSIGAKEQLKILLAEYTSLRTEANARVTSIYQVASITAAVVIWLLKDGGGPFYLYFIAAFLGLFICAWNLARDLGRTGIRIKQIETEINKRAGEHLMVWENEWGGQASKLWGSPIVHCILGLNRPPYSS